MFMVLSPRSPLCLCSFRAADVASIPLAVDTDVVIVGSGLAGLTAAVVLFDSGARVTIVEKEGYMGGNTGKVKSALPLHHIRCVCNVLTLL